MAISPDSSSRTETPIWLNDFENRRKRPHKLAHEIGAGSPCLACHGKCKGLNLHYWRKICIECKCRKEDHDFIDDEEYTQFEILFGSKQSKKSATTHNCEDKLLDWVPENIPDELIVDYVNTLLQSKIPISNAQGAAYRKQKLEKQLPLHDVSPNACHNLTEEEGIELGKYVENLKMNAIGLGTIFKFKYESINGRRQACEMADSPSRGKLSDLSEASDKLLQGPELEVQSVFHSEMCNESCPTVRPTYMKYIERKMKNSNNNSDSFGFDEQLKSKLKVSESPVYKLSGHIGKPEITKETEPLNSKVLNSSSPLNIAANSTFSIAKHRLEDHKPHYGLKACDNHTSTKAPTECRFHNNNNNNVLLKNEECNLSHADNVSCNTLGCESQNSSILNDMDMGSPSIVDHSCAIKTYKDQTNINVACNSRHEEPILPDQKIYHLSEKTEGSQKNVVLQHKAKAFMDKAEMHEQICTECKVILRAGDIVVNTERGGNSSFWHGKCFICHRCKELLVDLLYFYYKGNVYCGRDYAAVMKIPRCFACDELIFVKEYTQAEGKPYHVKHFCCFHCDEPLGGKRYVLKDNHPVCLKCYEDQYGKKCSTCFEIIPVDEQRVSWGELNFHMNPSCFCCKNCLKCLIGGRFVMKNEKTFCSKECVKEFCS